MGPIGDGNVVWGSDGLDLLLFGNGQKIRGGRYMTSETSPFVDTSQRILQRNPVNDQSTDSSPLL